MTEADPLDAEESISALDGPMRRNEFIALVLQRAVLTGTVLTGPKLLEKFLIPPAWAFGSSCTTADTVHENDIVVMNSGSTANPTDNDDSYVTFLTPGEATYCVVSLGTGKPISQY